MHGTKEHANESGFIICNDDNPAISLIHVEEKSAPPSQRKKDLRPANINKKIDKPAGKTPAGSDKLSKNNVEPSGSKSNPKRKRNASQPSSNGRKKQKKVLPKAASKTTKPPASKKKPPGRTKKPPVPRTTQKKQAKRPKKKNGSSCLKIVEQVQDASNLAISEKRLLPPLSFIMATIARTSKTVCHSGGLEEDLKTNEKPELLPSFKELCGSVDDLPFHVLIASAMKNQPDVLASKSQTQELNTQEFLANESEIASGREDSPNELSTLKSQNERFANEILVLREELVLAYGSHEVPASRSELRKCIEGKQNPCQDFTPPRIHTAITLIHLAAQVAGLGMAYIPKEIPKQWGSMGTSNPFVHCAKDGFSFIRAKMEQKMTLKSMQSVSLVFKDVHLKLVEDLFSEKNCRSDGSVTPAQTKVTDFILAQIQHVYEELLDDTGTVHIDWSRHFCEAIVNPLCMKLHLVSGKFEKAAEKIVMNVLKRIAEMLRDAERDKPGLSIRSLCHALEVSMAIALTLPASAKQLPIEFIYTIGRHNVLFSDHIFFLDSEKHTATA